MDRNRMRGDRNPRNNGKGNRRRGKNREFNPSSTNPEGTFSEAENARSSHAPTSSAASSTSTHPPTRNLRKTLSQPDSQTANSTSHTPARRNGSRNRRNGPNSGSWRRGSASLHSTPVEQKNDSTTRDDRSGENQELTSDDSKKNTVSFRYERKQMDLPHSSRLFWLPKFEMKFCGFIESLDPLFRFRAGIGTCRQLDSEGIKTFYQKFAKIGLPNPWPFDDEKLEIDQDDLREIYSKIMENVKLCLHMECLKRGFIYSPMRYFKIHLSSIWMEEVDLICELNMLKTVVNTIRASLTKNENLNFDEIATIKELDTIFAKVLPALQTGDSATLQKHNIQDLLVSIPDRIKYGFAVEDSEIDAMLEALVADEKNFGDFPAVASQYVHFFKTRKQLNLILLCIENMFKMMDIRVKNGAVRAITQILRVLPPEELNEVFADPAIRQNVNLSKILGCESIEFEFDVSEDGRSKYFKMFLTALGINDPNTIIEKEALTAALGCFYLICKPVDVNFVVYKILSSRRLNPEKGKEAMILHHAKDCDLLISAMLSLPENLRKKLEIGEEFSVESHDSTSNFTDSMHFQITHALNSISSEKVCANQLYQFLFGSKTRIVSIERVFRKFMNFVQDGKRQKYAVEGMMLLTRDYARRNMWSSQFVEDIVLLALAKYSLPGQNDIKEKKKFAFIEQMLSIGQMLAEKHGIVIDKASIAERWKSLNHPWFTYLYLSEYFPILEGCNPPIEFPWNEVEQKSVGDYAELARLSTAWPKCYIMTLIDHVASKVVPVDIPRIELYTAMKEFVDNLEIDDTWKDCLKCAYDQELICPSGPLEETGFTNELICEENEEQIMEEVDVEKENEENVGLMVEERHDDGEKAAEEEEEEEEDLSDIVLDEEAERLCKHVSSKIWAEYSEEKRNQIKRIRKAFEKKEAEKLKTTQENC